jgi:hypothetical protein
MRCIKTFIILLSLFSCQIFAEDSLNQTFSPNENVQKMAEAYAEDTVTFAKNQFGITLDWSDASIGNIEQLLDKTHSSYISTSPKPTQEQVMSFAKGYGSYIGEVYRRNHGAEWGIVTLGGQKMPGLRTKAGVSFWPWARAANRITEGAENNVKDYYNALFGKQP